MTDVDRLPADDGARWRDAQPEPDPALLRRRRLRWQPLAAAAAVVAIAAGVVGCAQPGAPADPAPAAGPADEIVRDGDTVAGQGYFLALPGRPVQLCGPASGPRRVIPIQPWPDETKVPEPCRNAVTVSGIDLDRLSERKERDGAVWGWARVEGVYRARTLTVTRQEAYVSGNDEDSGPKSPPCPEPAGGWQFPMESLTGDAATRLSRVIRQHPDELNELYVTYPYGDPPEGEGVVPVMVLVVNTTGDVAEARRLLEAVFPAEHLCVRKATWSARQMDAAVRELENSTGAERLKVAPPDKDPMNDRVTTRVLVLDEAMARFLAGVAGGRITPAPVLRKVR